MAIAFDKKTTISGAATTAFTVANNPNRLLLCYIYVAIDIPTYNGVSMTLWGQSPSGAGIKIYYLIAPAIGTHNIVTTESSSIYGFASFYGVNQSTPIGVTGITLSSADTIQTILTGLGTNSMVMEFTDQNTGSVASTGVGTGQTDLGYITNYFAAWSYKLGVTGSTTISRIFTGPFAHGQIAMEILSTSTPPIASGFLMFFNEMNKG